MFFSAWYWFTEGAQLIKIENKRMKMYFVLFAGLAALSAMGSLLSFLRIKAAGRRKTLAVGLALVTVLCALVCARIYILAKSPEIREIAAPPRERVEEMPLIVASADDWPWWRGPTLDGKAAPPKPPITWGPAKNIAWKVDVPGRGHASPSIWGGRVFIVTADEQAETIDLLCYDRQTGNQFWKTEIHRGPLGPKHEKNSHASATPACDGQYVYVVAAPNGELRVAAVDLEGRIAWRSELGSCRLTTGYAASPVLYRSLLIVAGEGTWRPFLVALDRSTGAIVWRVRRQGESFASPIVAQLAGRPQLILAGVDAVTSYDPASATLLWCCRWPPEGAVSTVAFAGDRIYASAKKLLCIRADGSGDVTDTHTAWSDSRLVARVPSPVVHEGRLYLVTDNGIGSCFDAHTGEVLWKERLGGNFSASLVLAGGNIYATNEEGTTIVFKAESQYEQLSRNELEEATFATPAICGGRLFLRTENRLYCIGSPGK